MVIMALMIVQQTFLLYALFSDIKKLTLAHVGDTAKMLDMSSDIKRLTNMLNKESIPGDTGKMLDMNSDIHRLMDMLNLSHVGCLKRRSGVKRITLGTKRVHSGDLLTKTQYRKYSEHCFCHLFAV